MPIGWFSIASSSTTSLLLSSEINRVHLDSPQCLKGIVHPKMKMRSSFTHPYSSSRPVWISLFCWTQRNILWIKLVTRLFWGTIDFHSRRKNYYGSQWCPRTALFPTFFRISSFVFSRTNTFIQVWNYLRMSKWPHFHFWVNYPFKDTCFCRTKNNWL